MRSEVWVRRLRGAERLASGRFFWLNLTLMIFIETAICAHARRDRGAARVSRRWVRIFSVRAGGRFERVFRVAGRERGSRA